MGNCIAHEVLCSPSFSSRFCPSPPISLFLILYCTIIWEYKIKAAFSITLCHDQVSTPSTASTQDHLSPAPIQSLISCLSTFISYVSSLITQLSTLNSHLSSRGRPCCTLLTTFPLLQVNQEMESLLLLNLPSDPLPRYHMPQSTPLILLDCHCQVYLCVHTLSACNSIYMFQWLWPPRFNASGIHIHLHSRSVMASKVASSWPPSMLLNFLDYSPKYISELAWFRAPSVVPNMLNHNLPSSHDDCLQVHLQTCLITALQSTHSWLPWASPSSHNHGLQVHVWVHSISAPKYISIQAQSQPPTSHDRGLQVHLLTHSMKAASVSLSSLNLGLQVHPWVQSITVPIQGHLQIC